MRYNSGSLIMDDQRKIALLHGIFLRRGEITTKHIC